MLLSVHGPAALPDTLPCTKTASRLVAFPVSFVHAPRFSLLNSFIAVRGKIAHHFSGFMGNAIGAAEWSAIECLQMKPRLEPEKNMTIAIRLSPAAEKKRRELAAQRGQDVAGVAAELLEK